MYASFNFLGCAMAQAVSRRPVTAEARVLFQVSRFVMDKVVLGQIFLPVLRFSPVSFHQRSKPISSTWCSDQKDNCSFENCGALDRKHRSIIFCLVLTLETKTNDSER
jgi:hypothetical protein